MKSVSKAELLKLIDEHIPDDARLAVFSSMAYEVYPINKEQMGNIFAPVGLVFDEEDMPDDVGDVTHVLGGA